MKKPTGFNTTQIKQLTTIVGKVVDTKLDNKLKPIHSKLNKLQKDLTGTIEFFDQVTIDHDKRITKIENNLQFSSV